MVWACAYPPPEQKDLGAWVSRSVTTVEALLVTVVPGRTRSWSALSVDDDAWLRCPPFAVAAVPVAVGVASRGGG